MVLKFAVQEKMPPHAIDLLMKELEVGNLDQLMPMYEGYIAKPIISALAGPLGQLLLIMVQKQRVDLARGW